MTRFYLIQSDVVWEQPEANRQQFTACITGCTDGVIVLPEMFSTGFSMASSKLAESMTGDTLTWMKHQANALNSVLCGSLIVTEATHYFNRFLWVEPGGQIIHYDKRHLFRMAGEHNHYNQGKQRVTLQANELRILPQVCYGLRFPAFSRNRDDYDVMLFVAHWPAAR